MWTAWRSTVQDLAGLLLPSVSSASLSITAHFKQDSELLPAEAMWP